MKKYFLTALQILSLSACANKIIENEAGNSLTDHHQIQLAVDEAQKTGNLPGVAVLVWKQDQIKYFNSQGKRSLHKEAKVESHDKWHLGSDTKAMTAFLIALAVQKDQLAYDLRLIDVLGDKVKFHPMNGDLTIADLLSHSSGLKDVQEVQGGKLWKEIFKSKKSMIAQRAKMMRAALAEEPHRNPKNSALPMRGYGYANVNYVILGSILEGIYESDWESLLKKDLFQPLGMTSCGFGTAGNPNETEPSQPWPHVMDHGKLIGVPPKEKLDNPPMLGPAGTVHCNLSDWRKFITELTAAWNDRGQLLKDKSVVDLYFASANDSVYTYGGWGRIQGKYKSVVFSHDGSNSFNYVVAFFSPDENSGFLLATNSGAPEAEAAIGKLKKFLVLASTHRL